MRVFFASVSMVLALGLIVLAGPGLAQVGWQRLGTKVIDLRGMSDTIVAGRNIGRFSAIMLEVNDGAIEISNIRVLYGNGGAYAPASSLVFGPDSHSWTIDLPGATQIIRTISFSYRSLRTGQARATITAYGG